MSTTTNTIIVIAVSAVIGAAVAVAVEEYRTSDKRLLRKIAKASGKYKNNTSVQEELEKVAKEAQDKAEKKEEKKAEKKAASDKKS